MRTAQLRFELEKELEDKTIFKKEWLEDLTDEQEDAFYELFEVQVQGKYDSFPVNIIALEGKYFEAVDREDYKSHYVEVSEVDLETLEWFIEQEAINLKQ